MSTRTTITSFSVLALAALFPFAANAQVVINEAMYDPPGADSAQEWIELYNAGSANIDLTKWKFVDGSSTTKHSFNVPPKNGGIGSIVIPSGGYVIVADDAATFEAAYPSVANVVDSTMSMPDPNAGVSETLTLYDDQGNSEDTFTYTGGSNADNKGDSVQRAGTTIIPALPTPAAANATVADTSSTDTPDSSDTSDSASSTSTTADTQTTTQTTAVSSYVPPPSPSLYADAGNDRTVIVGADSEFDASAYDKDQNVLDDSTVRFSWNFGDGTTAEGASVEHHFQYPGRYAVVLNIAENRDAASDEIIVTAEPAQLAFNVLSDGGVEIDDLAGRDLDLSDWIIKAGAGVFDAQFMLPPESKILSGSSMHITEQTLKFSATAQAELAYPNGVEALGAGESTASTSPPVVVAGQDTAALPPAPAPASAASVPDTEDAPADDEVQVVSDPTPAPMDTATDTATSTAQTASVAGAAGGSMMWWIAAAALAAATSLALMVARWYGKKEWDIVEENAT